MEIQYLRETVYRQICLEYLQSPRSEKKWKITPGAYVFLRKRTVTIFGLLMACGRWGHVFVTSANPRSCIKNVAVSPSFTVRMGENVKETEKFNTRIESMVQAAFVRGIISVGSYQPRD